KIDKEARKATMANHSALHLLQAALQRVVGSHVHQAGSFVCAQYGRFDFTHFEKVSAEQLSQIEDMVNKVIAANYPVVTDLMDLEEAKNSGAMALFDEKYDEVVRVVSMGDFSKELCGGTHVRNTAEIGCFKIESEESIGSGIRRITVVTGYGAYQYSLNLQNMLNDVATRMKMTSVTGVVNKVQSMIDENASLKQTIGQLKNQLLLAQADEIVSEAEEVNGLKVLVKAVECESSQVKNLAQSLISKLKEGVVFVGTVNEGKVMFVAECSKQAQAQGFKASDLVKKAAVICGGNGGGRPDEASAGGKDSSKFEEAMSEIRNLF
ncbi:MAG: alanine--tRNA ligase, partial [Erysipelotrichaceae bacterium]|nr:alanine--tRNA ligase [Erysipelotrichaceae bacterium]